MRISVPMRESERAGDNAFVCLYMCACVRLCVCIYAYIRNLFLISNLLHLAPNFYVCLFGYMHPRMRSCCLYVCEGTRASVCMYVYM